MAERAKQIDTTPITIGELMAHERFLQGYDEVFAGKPFDPAHITPPMGECKWGYERGRQFAVLQKTHGPQRKFRIIQPDGVNGQAIALFWQFSSRGWLR